MNSIDNIISEAQDALSNMIDEQGQSVSAEELGLDSRIGQVVVVGNQHDGAIIATSESKARTLDYYGGFEYVDAEDITVLGGYKIYSSMSSRVARALEWLEEEVEA